MGINQAPSLHERTGTLLSRVGDRVRRARTIKGIPRRVLSEVSGVSPRYLAQLEAGGGNISISLLARVAQALDHRIEWLLSDDDPVTSETWQIAERFRHASPEVRARVLAAFEGGPTAARSGRICLIGLRGAGKSTLGKRMGESYGVPFVELNAEIEALGQMPVGEIMALYGPDGYRRFEAEALKTAIERNDAMILEVAGGIVSDSEVYETLLARCHTIWVKADPQEHMDRVRAQGDLRPMEGRPEAMDQLKRILNEREGRYGQAQAILDTGGRSLEQSTAELKTLIDQRGFLNAADA